MATNDDLVEIDLDADDDVAAVEVDAGKKADTGKKNGKEVAVDAGKDAAASPSADEVAAKLRKDLDTERSARQAAERRATETATRAETAEKEVGTTQLQLVTSAIATLKAESDRLEADYEAAFGAQDGKAMAKIQRQMADASAKLLQLENGKTAMEEEAKKPLPAKRIEHKDPVEELAAQLTPRSASWVREHPEFARDNKKYQAMIGAHNVVMNSRTPPEPDSDEYFERVEKILDIAPEVEISDDDAGASAPLSAAASTAQRRASPAAAPVSRSGTASGVKTNRVTLTAAEIEAAESSGLTPKQYYENKMALRKDGRLN